MPTTVGNHVRGGVQVCIIHGNVVDVGAAEATAVFVYLVPAGMAAVKNTLVSLLRAGARVVTYGEASFGRTK